MIERKITIESKDGFKLGTHVREPNTQFKGVVQINSGTGIPQEFHSHFAKYLTRHRLMK